MPTSTARSLFTCLLYTSFNRHLIEDTTPEGLLPIRILIKVGRQIQVL